jgi:hypothetical protein
MVDIAAISALNVEAGGFGGECAGADDDTRYANEMGHICRCEAANGGLRDRGVEEELMAG